MINSVKITNLREFTLRIALPCIHIPRQKLEILRHMTIWDILTGMKKYANRIRSREHNWTFRGKGF